MLDLKQPTQLARLAQLAAFEAAAIFLAVIAWRMAPIDLSAFGKITGALGAGVFGAVINPHPKPGADSDLSAPQAPDMLWTSAVTVGALCVIATSAAVAWSRPNAGAVLAAVATAFGALFVDTSRYTHPMKKG